MAQRTSNKEYIWTVGDYVDLNNRLGNIESDARVVREDIKEIKDELSNRSHIVVDNTTNSKERLTVIAVVVTSAVAGLLVTLNQLGVIK